MPRWERSRSLARTDSTLRSVMGGLSGGGDEGAYFSGQGLCRLNVRLAEACNRLTSRNSRSSPRTHHASRHLVTLPRTSDVRRVGTEFVWPVNVPSYP